MKRIQHVFAHISLLLLFVVSISVGGDGGSAPATGPQETPPTSPNRDLVLGKMSINGVELQYSGPVQIPDGGSAIVALSFTNMQDRGICMNMSRIEERFCFAISVKSPKGKLSSFQTFGVMCEREAGGILSLASGKTLEERLDLARYLADGPGLYSVTIIRDYNGVIIFPGYSLRLDVPLTVVAEKPEKPKGMKRGG